MCLTQKDRSRGHSCKSLEFSDALPNKFSKHFVSDLSVTREDYLASLLIHNIGCKRFTRKEVFSYD